MMEQSTVDAYQYAGNAGKIAYSEFKSETDVPKKVIVLTEKRKLLNDRDFAKNQEYITRMVELLKNYR